MDNVKDGIEEKLTDEMHLTPGILYECPKYSCSFFPGPVIAYISYASKPIRPQAIQPKEPFLVLEEMNLNEIYKGITNTDFFLMTRIYKVIYGKWMGYIKMEKFDFDMEQVKLWKP